MRQDCLTEEKGEEVAPRYYPVFLNLRGKGCVVVGGGAVAARKVSVLLLCGAAVTVISPTLSGPLSRQHRKGVIGHRSRRYRKGDLAGAFLVVAATGDAQVNARVARDAPCLVNVVDRPELGNFIVPSRVSRGPLTIAVSTSGASPALSREIGREIAGLYRKDFGEFLRFAARLRRQVIRDVSGRGAKEKIVKGIASPELLRTLRTEGVAAAKDRVRELVRDATGGGAAGRRVSRR